MEAMIRKASRILLVLAAFTTTASVASSTQSASLPSDHLPEFEVATVKPALMTRPAEWTGVHILSDGRLIINSYSLKILMILAFRIGPWQISGGDGWTEKALYDVEAKPPENSPGKKWDVRHSTYRIEDDRLCQMLQALLIDRFHLKFHRTSKIGTVFLLEMSGKTISLTPTKTAETTPAGSVPATSGWIEGSGNEWVISNASMAQLATFTSMALQHPVIDRTGVTGAFDYRSPPPQSGTHLADDFADSLMNLLREVGFKLEQSKGPVETFVIDHAAYPSPN